MKKVLLVFIFIPILTNLIYGEEVQNTPNPASQFPNLPTSQPAIQNETIDFPIKDAPVEITPSSEAPSSLLTESKKPHNPNRALSDPKESQTFLKEKTKPKNMTFTQEEFYEPKKDEMALEREEEKLFLNIHSKALEQFMAGAVYETKQQVQTFALKDSFTQITNVDGKIYEYKYAQKSIDRYSAIAPYQKYPLKKISPTKYQILIDELPQVFDIKGCKIAIKKQLSGTLYQKREVIIDLDTKRELRNESHFDLFLECPK
ncbi:hypothetical protein [Helicobacter sp. 11S02596-1]|uniref:hypothetical protein n=1 Tax=Helicobacter sp. 11S02596-1 TaxID=1476194 RepID=UPI000BA69387|nr:hypothetical protein [Helicobacter sp. 11S02596-1]PAF42341.1 hypothetical protein BJI48_06905 [Helicobacter sp. 11S02596-1]